MIRIEYNPITDLCIVDLCNNTVPKVHDSHVSTNKVEVYPGACGMYFWNSNKIFIDSGRCHISPKVFKKAVDILKEVGTLGEIEVNYQPKRI